MSTSRIIERIIDALLFVVTGLGHIVAFLFPFLMVSLAAAAIGVLVFAITTIGNITSTCETSCEAAGMHVFRDRTGDKCLCVSTDLVMPPPTNDSGADR
jgi:hypothetical protein